MDTVNEAVYHPYDAGLPGDPGKVDVLTIRVVRERQQEALTTVIKSPACAAHILSTYLGGYDRECMVALLLNTKSHVIGIHMISMGTVSEAIVHPREVFKAAILVSAFSILLAHNHPSGETQESREDITITERLVKAGVLLGIPVLDHVIVGPNLKFNSAKENNWLRGTD